MGVETGAEGQELCSASLQPTLEFDSAEVGEEKSVWDLLLVFFVVKDTLRVALDGNVKSGIEELLGGSGGESRSTLKLLLFATEPEGLTSSRHVDK